jgi:hypothetical protein
MIPHPAGNRSRRRRGGGLKMSKPRKSIKLTIRYFHAGGTATSASICPAASSTTTNWGSAIPLVRASDPAAGIPIAAINAAAANAVSVSHSARIWWCETNHHTPTAAADVQVPGPGRKCPKPKQVAMAQARREYCFCCFGNGGLPDALVSLTWAGGVRLAAGASGALFSLLNGLQVYHLVRRLNGGGDDIAAARPLT